MFGGVRGRKMKVGGKLLHFPPTRFVLALSLFFVFVQYNNPQKLQSYFWGLFEHLEIRIV
jgi:hypothetical protein